MIAVDELAAPLTDHAVAPGDGIRVHPTADVIGCLVDAARKTGILQGQSRVESRDSGSNDGNARHSASPLKSLILFTNEIVILYHKALQAGYAPSCECSFSEKAQTQSLSFFAALRMTEGATPYDETVQIEPCLIYWRHDSRRTPHRTRR